MKKYIIIILIIFFASQTFALQLPKGTDNCVPYSGATADVDLNNHSLTGMGNITGTDVDISAGTGDYSSSGTVQAEKFKNSGGSITPSYGIAFGDNVSLGNAANIGSVAFGKDITISGTNGYFAFVCGLDQSVLSRYSFTSGVHQKNYANYSVLMGASHTSNTTAAYGFAAGVGNTISGSRNIAMGSSLTLSGNYTIGFGKDYTVSTASSFNVGWGAIDLQITTGLADFKDTKIQTTGTLDARVATIGDGTNETEISSTGDLTFAGSAGLYPRVLNQSAKPTAGTGATQLDTGEMCMWTDTDDSKCYMCYNHGGTIKTVELN